MSSLSKKTPLIAIAALLVAGGALAFIAFGNIGENLVYYWAPGELLDNGEKAYGPTIRMGGVVRQGSVNWDQKATRLSFEVADDVKPEARFVKVESSELPPQMFREGIGVVVEGTYDRSGVFSSTRLMVNHSNEYRAPKDGEDVEKMWRETLSDTTASTGAK
ncbi:MAG: cytochrome c maturation protein CcmE [Myxococcaceae bacterium]